MNDSRVVLLGLVLASGLACSGGQQPQQRVTSPPASAQAALVASAAATANTSLPIRYLVAPHPDDEFAIWSMVADTDHYPALVVLTHGEQTGSCTGSGLQAGDGERAPLPQPFAGKLTATCSAQRVDSLLAFLAGMAAADPRWTDLRDHGEHVVGSAPVGCTPGASCANYRLWLGAGAALLVFDLGDGNVTPGKVVWAVQATRAARLQFPTQREDDIVGMGYNNPSDASSMKYDHPDQRALRTVLTTTKLGLPGAQYSRTYPADPARSLARQVDAKDFALATRVDPGPDDPQTNLGAERIGPLQVDYGWLAFPGAYWYAESEPVHSFFSQSQDFTKSF